MRTRRHVFLVPGMVLLVPGVFGLLSFGRLYPGEPAGAVGASQTLTLGAALAIGLVLANACLPVRKSL